MSSGKDRFRNFALGILLMSSVFMIACTSTSLMGIMTGPPPPAPANDIGKSNRMSGGVRAVIKTEFPAAKIVTSLPALPPDTSIKRVPESAKKVAQHEISATITIPELIKKVVLPELVNKASLAESPKKVVGPELPKKVILPEPPKKVLAPDLPKKVILPEPPKKVIAPDLPKKVILPEPPKKVIVPEAAISSISKVAENPTDNKNSPMITEQSEEKKTAQNIAEVKKKDELSRALHSQDKESSPITRASTSLNHAKDVVAEQTKDVVAEQTKDIVAEQTKDVVAEHTKDVVAERKPTAGLPKEASKPEMVEQNKKNVEDKAHVAHTEASRTGVPSENISPAVKEDEEERKAIVNSEI